MDTETLEIAMEFILKSSKVIADCDCSHEIKKEACTLDENLWPT